MDYNTSSKLSPIEELEILQKYDYKCIRCGAETNRIHKQVKVTLCNNCFVTWAKKYPYVAISVLMNLKVKYSNVK